MRNLLILVDPQNDFITGSLAVPGADVAIRNVKELLNNDIAFIAITCDTHPPTHCSFKENGGEWPIHCVTHSKGAALPDYLIEILIKSKAYWEFFDKGLYPKREEYSIFQNSEDGNDLTDFIDDQNFDHIYIAGLAGDFCVYETTLDLINMGYSDKIILAMDCIASIDGGSKLQQLATSKGLLSWFI